MSKIKNDIDILMISETKLDERFPIGQFHIEGFGTPIRLDRNQNRGAIMLLSREGILIKLLSSDIALVESFCVEINYIQKWLLNCSYNPDKSNISMHLSALRKSLDLYFAQYENFIIIRDFNVEFDNNPADTDVFKTSSRRIKKVMTSYDQTRRRQDVWKKTSYLHCLEDVQFMTS